LGHPVFNSSAPECKTPETQKIIDILLPKSPIQVLYIIFIDVFFLLTQIFRFSEDIRFMNGSPPGIWWKACWMFISPCLILAILISSFVSISKESLLYDAWTRDVSNNYSSFRLSTHAE
jgi:hypothetical protein